MLRDSWIDRLSRSPRQIARPLMVAGVRVQAKVLKLLAEYLVKTESKVAIRYALCVGDESEDQMLIRRCNVL